MKSNPLFHDSTVSQGANIQTKFEINGVHLTEGQILCLKLIVGNQVRFLEMRARDESTYVVSAWIEHRKRISYQFFVQIDGDIVSATEIKTSLALHTIVEDWTVTKDSNWKKNFSAVSNEIERLDVDFIDTDKDEEAETYIDNLIDKWGL